MKNRRRWNQERDDFQTPTRGTLEQEYENYRENAEALGWYVETFDEWLNS